MQEWRRSLRAIRESAQPDLLERIGVQPERTARKEAFLPLSAVEADLRAHPLLVAQDLDARDVYNVLVQMLLLVDGAPARGDAQDSRSIEEREPWRCLAREWVTLICNGAVTERHVRLAWKHLRAFFSHHRTIRHRWAVAAALLIVERPTMLADQRIGMAVD